MANTEYFEYNNGIYPVPLCIAVGLDWHNDDFDEDCNSPLDEHTAARTFDTSSEKVGKCILIRFANKKAMSMGIIAHEALHATAFIFDYIGDYITATHSEPAAYLLQWIVWCCENVKLGKTK